MADTLTTYEAAKTDESIGTRRRRWLADARLYLVIEARLAGRDIEAVLRSALKAGVDIVQLREKNLNDRDTVMAGRTFRRLCDAYDALFIVNDRPDLALSCGADGVHVGQDDAAVAGVRKFIGPDMLIGLSTHSTDQIAAAEGADYIGVGPVYETATKPGRPAVGLELVHHAATAAQVPFFAIGGIDQTNVFEVVEAGAQRVACVRAIRDADDPGRVVTEFRRAVGAGLSDHNPGPR